ncbi:hypothetical protein FEE96_22480 [Parasedimentitalea maritima]|uniref:Uncharacterized protein n=1 Tax=Parasedimentitalea maritima TaxID=2578117 RepID=A0ABY2UNJ7_9RHOB|nr:hypothetical protein FEE96_22480 [Zongyanglinia marina]
MLRSCMKAAASSRKCRASEVGKSKVGVVRTAVSRLSEGECPVFPFSLLDMMTALGWKLQLDGFGTNGRFGPFSTGWSILMIDDKICSGT